MADSGAVIPVEHVAGFPGLLQWIHERSFTGAILMHYHQGRPVEAQILSSASRIRLDKVRQTTDT